MSKIDLIELFPKKTFVHNLQLSTSIDRRTDPVTVSVSNVFFLGVMFDLSKPALKRLNYSNLRLCINKL